jgi:hypothetical protein
MAGVIRTRLWKFVKWASAVTCALALIAIVSNLIEATYGFWVMPFMVGMLTGAADFSYVPESAPFRLNMPETGWWVISDLERSNIGCWRRYCWPRFWVDSGGVYRATFPLWPILIVSALMFAYAARRCRRPAVGCCQSCGYNLTGNVSGRCPECGTDPAKAGRDVKRGRS